ncbi:MAG: hypothetical protein JWO56_3375 [Acidobacteria bacterium]|nr:hypothetical protein [Acidobacteriota bacterium]
MKKLRNQKLILFALLVLLAAFAGCKGESPTAPNPTPGNPGGIPGGSVTPPTGASIVLTVTNASPLAASVTTITATVTQNGQPVPNGTAVEFSTSFGSFSLSDPNVVSIIRTTTSGVATITLTAPSPGPAVVTAVVNNVSARTTITFQAQQVPPIIPSTAPTITSVAPNLGRPAGGETITINGTNFRAPARVIFDFGSGVTKDAFVVSVTPTQIVALTPPIDVSTAQQRQATITVIVDAGSASEQKVTSAANAFTFQSEVLTPTIIAVSPASGPIDGGTRVTIFGDAFQAPVQVFFGSAEAQVVSIAYKQLVVMSPTARDTNPNASGPVTGPIEIRVVNINSNKTATLAAGFRYVAHVQITANGPGAGSAFGGTRVTIDGTGFNDPVTVVIGTVPALVISVNNSQIVAITSPVPTPCTPPSGPIVVTNVDNGDTSSGGAFAYIAEKPLITSVSPSTVTEGQNFTVRVLNPGVGQGGTGSIRINAGGANTFASPSLITNPIGPLDFTAIAPSLAFPDVVCTTSGGVAGTQKGPLTVDVTFANLTTGCTDIAANSIKVFPSGTNTCAAPPTPPPPSASINPATYCPNGFGTAMVGSTTTRQVSVHNSAPAGGSNLQVTSATIVGGPDSADFTVSPTTATIPPGTTVPLTITFVPTAAGPRNGTLNIFTNDPANTMFSVCLQGTGM